MSTITTETHTPPQFGDVLYEITADEFLGLIETGFFPEDARVYLQDGRIYEKMAKTNAHGLVGSIIATALVHRLPPVWSVVSEGQFKLDRKNSPLPDIMVIRGGQRTYLAEGRSPEPADIGLVVEIAVTSLAKDLGPNLERHARALVPIYWVADVTGRRILAHSQPRVIDGRGEYESVVIVEPGGSLPLVLDGQEAARFTYEELMP